MWCLESHPAPDVVSLAKTVEDCHFPLLGMHLAYACLRALVLAVPCLPCCSLPAWPTPSLHPGLCCTYLLRAVFPDPQMCPNSSHPAFLIHCALLNFSPWHFYPYFTPFSIYLFVVPLPYYSTRMLALQEHCWISSTNSSTQGTSTQ